MYEDRGDKSLIDLLTKRQFKKEIFKQSCPDVQQPQHVVRHTKTHIFRQIKTDWRYGILHISAEDLMKRLTLLTGARRACNNNFQLRFEVWKITDELSELSVISKAHDAY